MSFARKHLSYILFGLGVFVIVGLAVNHSRHMRYLVDALSSPDVAARRSAASELIEGEQFIDSISGEGVYTRVRAAGALRDLGTAPAVTQALALMKDTDKPVRDAAVLTLKAIGGNSPANIHALVDGLKDGDPAVRRGATIALTDPNGGIGSKPGVVEQIVKLMKAEAGARGPGGDVLGSAKFRTDSAESVALLSGILKDKDEAVRVAAADALGKVGSPAALPELETAMQTDSAQVRRASIGAIALIADPAGEAALTGAIRNPDDDGEARAQAAAGLGKIATPSALNTLIAALNDNDLKLREAAVAALARAARPTPETTPNHSVTQLLARTLSDNRQAVRLGAAQALETTDSTDANTALITTLRYAPVANDDPEIAASTRSAAATALGFPGNTPAVRPLISAFDDRAGVVADAAVAAVARIGASATPTLVSALSAGGPNALYASRALALQGVTALPSLERAAKSGEPSSRRWAAVALGDLGTPDARPSLQALAADPNPDLSYVARQQLDRLGR